MSARTTMLTVLLLSAMLAMAHAQDAGLEDNQTAVSGTDEADDIEIEEDQDATASIDTQEGGELSAKATGVDAKGGDDTVSGSLAVTTSATATANLQTLPKPTEARATAVGIDAGDGDDTVGGALAFTSTAIATGVYADSSEFQPEAGAPPPNDIDVSIKTTADASGIVTGGGDDSAGNDALFAVTSLATSGGTANQFNATVRDSVNLKNQSEAKATSRALHTGDGADSVTNHGLVSNIATATSGALAIGLVAPEDTDKPPASSKTQIKTDASSKAEANSVGIDTEDEDTEDSSEDTSPWEVNGLKVTYHKTVTTVSADDTVENNVALVNAAIANSGAGSGAISNQVEGSVDATATSEASAEGVAITTGGGADQVINRGELRSTATANAIALSVSIEVGPPGEPAPAPAPGEAPKPPKPSNDTENKSQTHTSVTARARATGIDAEGSGTRETLDKSLELTQGALVADVTAVNESLAGDDVVENHGAIQSIAGATANSTNASVLQSSGGSTRAESKSTASSYAAGVTTAGGNDVVANHGALTVSATSDASAISLGLAAGQPPPESPPGSTPPASPPPGGADADAHKVTVSSETAVESVAEAIGVDTAGGAATTTTRHLEIRNTGLELNFGESQTTSPLDHDRVDNHGILTTTATANAGATDAAVALDVAGSLSSDASATASARSTGVSTGAGDDIVTNDFFFQAQADATARALSVGISAGKPATQGSSDAPDKTHVQVKAGAVASAATLGIDTEGSAHDSAKNTSLSISGNGLEVVRTRREDSLAGSDQVTNHGAMLVGANATSDGLAAGVTIGAEGSVGADAGSKSDATSVAVHTGGGADVIENSGFLTSDAQASAFSLALGITVAQPDSGTDGEPPPAERLEKTFSTTQASANTDATAHSTGIDADGTTHSRQNTDTYAIGAEGLTVDLVASFGSMSGDDIVTNTGALTSTSTALAATGAVAADIQSAGTAATETRANASATSNGVLTGGGHDRVTNSGVLLTDASATAGALSASLVVGAQPASPAPSPAPSPSPAPVPASADKESKASSDSSVTASARATGVDTEGTGHTQDSESHMSLTRTGLALSKTSSSVAAAGNDVVTNTGAITATGNADASTRNASIAVSSGGSTQADSKATAASHGAAITTGGGDDDITNSGLLISGATSSASATSIALAVGQPQETTPPDSAPSPPTTPANAPSKVAASSETRVTSEADAVGIDAEGRHTQTTSHRALDIDTTGIHYLYEDSAASAAGNDRVLNNAIVTVNSSAIADSTSAAIAIDTAGSVNAETQTQARAASAGIYTGGGDDIIENHFLIDADAEAHADSIALTVSAKKPPENSSDTPAPPAGAKQDKTNVKVDARATAQATASGIDAEGREHDTAHERSLTIDANTLQVTASNREDSQAGADDVINHGDIDVDATATSGAVSAGITLDAAGSVDVDTTSKAQATGAAILTGGGADTVTNTFLLLGDADATATALAAAVSVSQPTDGTGTKPSTLDGLREKFATAHSVANAEATANSTGIDTEGGASSQVDSLTIGNGGDGRLATLSSNRITLGGDDVVRNDGAIIVSAGALTLAGAGEVRVETEGTASSEANATSRSTSGGVLTGAGSDDVLNRGALTATSTTTSGALSVSFTQSGAAGTQAKSDARATSESRAVGIGTGGEETRRERELALTLGMEGVTLSHTDDSDAEDGADTIANEGVLNSLAVATSGAAGGAIAIDGSASTDITSTAKSRSDGIDAGGGDDHITNDGLLGTQALATSAALGVAFGQKGDEKTASQDKVQVTSVAEASAAGIRADSGATRSLDSSLTIGSAGLVAHLGYESTAATGDDTVINRGGIGVLSAASGGAAGVAVAIDGVAKADVDVTANSRASGIDAGGGHDSVLNEGELTIESNANAGAVAVSVGSKTSNDSRARTRVDTSSTASALGVGIATDGGSRNELLTSDLTIDASGLDFGLTHDTALVAGDDTLDNRNRVIARSHANSGAASVAVTVKGAANAVANSTATATSAALDTGGGADHVLNSGYLESTAAANAATLNAAISTEGRAISNAGLMGAGTTARARATGISTTGQEAASHVETSERIDFDDIGVSAHFEYVTDTLAGDGADVIDNRGEIFARSTADAPRVNAAITGKGVAVTMGKASSDSHVAGIDSGDLDDVIDNTGRITAQTESSATLANVAVTGKGLAVAANAVWDGGTEATAAAHGIDADGGERTTLVIDAEANLDLARVRYNKDVAAARGNDIIRNSGDVTSEATATAPSLNVGVVAGTGLAAAVSTATATADASALRGGDGDDRIENSGALTSQGDATAATANITFTNQGVAIAADAVWDGGTKATATSAGILADGGDRTQSEFIAVGTDQTTREKTGVLADGRDIILNSGNIDSAANSWALSLSAAVTMTGVGGATATSTASANATAIDAGAGASIDDVTNRGNLKAAANSEANAASVAVVNSGLAVSADSVWDGGTQANARARGIDVGAGGEVIFSSGDIEATAGANTKAAAVSITNSGVAGAIATSTATADAIAIDAAAGDDADDVTNEGYLQVTSNANAMTASVALTNSGLAIAADAVWDGGTTSNSRARGIDVGNTADVIQNHGNIDVTGNAYSKSLSASVTVNGVAGAIATSTSRADAIAIDAGTDAARDVVTNSATLNTTAYGESATSSVSFVMAGVALASDTPWDGGTGADAVARGIHVGSGSDDIINAGDVSANAHSVAASAAISVAVAGVAGALAKSTSTADAIALDAGAGAGDDLVDNTGALIASARADAASASVGFTTAGVAAAFDGGTRADSRSRGISLGQGLDTVTNDGDIESHSTAVATGASVSFALEGLAVAVSSAEAESFAFGIDADSGDDVIHNTAGIWADAYSNANAISASGTKFGVAGAGVDAWDGGATSTARAAAIRGDTGQDEILNTGDLTSDAHAVSPSVSLAFTVAGAAGAISTATSTAEAQAIDGGDDADRIENHGALTVTADSDAVAVSVALAGGGVVVAADSVWDGGTAATANASGIAGGSGDDVIDNLGADAIIDSTASASTHSISVSITGGGYAASTSTSTAIAEGKAVDGGAGNDNIFNDGEVTGRAEADATSASISVVGSGVAVATDAFWDGGTKATATAAGLDGGDGNDVISNAGSARAIAESATLSAAVAASLSPSFGLTFAAAASTSTADATAQHAGAGDDLLTNTGTLLAQSDAIADGISFSFTPTGGALAGGFDATTLADATVTGMDGAAGADTLTNAADATLTLAGAARTRTLAASMTLAGVALADANARAQSHGFGLAGGDGADSLLNQGLITGSVDANSSSASISFSLVGVVAASANSIAESGGAGLSGGAGADMLANAGEVNLTYHAQARGQSIGLTQGGLALSDAGAESSVAAFGQSGDAGTDTLLNTGRLHIDADALTTARSISASQFGGALAAANSVADSASTGMAGGADDDTIVNEATGVVEAHAAARVSSTGASVSAGGVTGAEARSEARVLAAGLSGGDGDDDIGNAGGIKVQGMTESTAVGGSLSVAGASNARAGTEVQTTAIGIDGGAGRDTILNTGTIEVGPEAAESWMSRLYAEAQGITFAGATDAESASSANTRATGLDGGADDDEIRNEGAIAVTANARSETKGGARSIFGASGSGGTSGAVTEAFGISGADGDDRIESLGDISVWSESNMTQSAATYTFGGSGESGGTLAAVTRTEGISGGAGADRIGNSGTLTLDARSTMNSSGNSQTTFGAASNTVTSGAVTRAFGIHGGDADDILENRAGGRIDIDARANVTASSSAYTFIGSGPSTGAVLTGDVGAVGLAGEAGNDTLINRGAITIAADAALKSTGGARSSVTGTSTVTSTGTSEVTARAAGFDGGDGSDLVGTYGSLDVHVSGTAEAINDASTGGFSVVNNNEAGAVTRADVLAFGIDAGAGANRGEIDGSMSVRADSIAYSLALSSGPTFTAASGGTSKITSTANATAIAVTGLDENDDFSSDGDISVVAHATTAKNLVVEITVLRDIRATGEDEEIAPPEQITGDALPDITGPYSQGTVVFWTQSDDDQQDPRNPEGTEGGHFQVQPVTVYPENGDPYEELRWVYLEDGLFEEVTIEEPRDSFPSYAAANGSGLAGSGVANATANATATAHGVVLGAGDNRFMNLGSFSVLAEAEAVAHASADGDGLGDATGSATVNGTASAIGVWLGDGDDTVENSGSIDVRATPIAQARVEASGGDICIWFFGWWCGGGGTGSGTSTLTVSGEAAGILAGGGDNVIVNDGDLSVISQPEIRVDPRTGEYVGAVNASDSRTVRLTLSSQAVGIETGDGNDQVANNGSLRVEAWDVRSACNASSCGGATPQTVTLQARGIVTGAGNDIVANNGSLVVETVTNHQRTHGLGIDTGAGDDELTLGDGSSIIGTVSLGDGDDTLVLRGTPTITNSAGVLMNVDAGAGADTLILDGAGAYAGTPLSIERAAKLGEGLYALPTLGSVSQLTTDAGTLHIDTGYDFAAGGEFNTVIHTDGRSALFSATGEVALDGVIDVEKRGETYVADGTRFTVVQGGTVSGGFSGIQLPEPRALLSFELDVQADAVDVVAQAASFATVTRNPLYREIAADLDTLTPGTDADLANLLGTIQNLEDGFDRAFASFSPESTLATAEASLTNLREMTRVLRNHLGESRLRYRHAPHARAPETALSFSGGSGGLGTMQLGASVPMLGMSEPPAAPATPQFRVSQAPRTQTWMLGIDAESENDAIAGYGAFDTDTRGFVLGGDRRVGEDWLLGITFGKSSTDVASGTLSTGDIDSWQASLYATWFDDRYHFEAGAAYGEQEFKDVRALRVGSNSRTAISQHDGDAWNVFAGGGVSFGTERWTLQPYVSANYIAAAEDGFQETGAGGMNLLIPAQDVRALFGEAGATFSVRHSLRSALLDWHASLAVGHDFGIDESGLFYAYAGAPREVFSIDGRPSSATSTLYGLGVSLLGDQSALSLDFQGARNPDRVEKFLSARVVVRF